MNRHALILSAFAVSLCCSSLASAGRGSAASFSIVPNFASTEEPAYCAGISADGSTVFGVLGVYGPGWVWSPSFGLGAIGGGRLCAASANGSIICGLMGDSSGMNTAGLWSAGPDWMSLGGLPDSPGCGSDMSSAFGMSRDGTVVGGLGWGGPSGCSALPMKWTQAEGMTTLPLLDPVNHNAGRVNAVSGNGQVFGGWESQADGTWRPIIWRNGTPSAAGAIDCNCGFAEILALNYDGSLATGYDENRAFMWTAASGPVLMTNSAGVVGDTYPMAISDNGRVIVGHYGFHPGNFFAQIWIDGKPSLVSDYLLAHGATGLDGYTLWSAAGVSADGTVIAGTAIQNSTGLFVPYRATIPALAPACPADIDGSQRVNTDDLLAMLGAWGACPAPCSTSCASDIVRTCTVDTDDLLALLGAWGACPQQ